MNAGAHSTADLTREHWVLAEAFTFPIALRHPTNIQARRQDRVLASAKDFAAKRCAAMAGKISVETRRES